MNLKKEFLPKETVVLRPVEVKKGFFQEPITRSLNLPYKPLETTFARIFLFLDVRMHRMH